MTLSEKDEINQVAYDILMEYESRLKIKVRGAKPYDGQNAKRIARHYKDSLLPGRGMVEVMVRGVLDELLALNDGFWISEPESEALTPRDSTLKWSIDRSGIKVTFDYWYCVSDDQQQLWVKCWYFPATYGT